MQSLTAIVVVASLLTNLNSFKEDPVQYQNNVLSQINESVAYFVKNNSGFENDELASLTEPVGQVLGEENEVAAVDSSSIGDSDTIKTSVTVLPATDEVTPTIAVTNTPTIVPTNTPVPKPTMQFDNSNVAEKILHAANEFGVDVHLMNNIADCESGYNPLAHNVKYDYAGLYQFHAQTWNTTRTRMDADPNPALRFSAQEAARTAAFKISQDGPGAWSGCL